MQKEKKIFENGKKGISTIERRSKYKTHESKQCKTNGINLTSNRTINILGVTFDSKLNWADHISNAIKRSMKALNAMPSD